MPTLGRTGNLSYDPLYKQVKAHITRALVAGDWKPGEPIPSETRLSAQFSVSVGTIRKAVDELVAESILLRQQGRGTFVTPHTEDRTLYYFFHIVGRDGAREPPTHHLLSFEKERADAEAERLLLLSRGDRVMRITNLLKVGGAPVILDEIVVPAARFPGLGERSFAAREGTIYGLYQSRYGINVVRIKERLSAALPDAAIATVLDIAERIPVLAIKRVAYTYQDAPVEIRTSWVNTAHHEYLSDRWKSEGRFSDQAG